MSHKPSASQSGHVGRFLTSSVGPGDVFTREDLTAEQKLFGNTAADFMRREVLPVAPRLYERDWPLTRELLRKAGALDLLRLEIPEVYGGLGLDKASAAYVFEQIGMNPSFGGSIGAHTGIGTAIQTGSRLATSEARIVDARDKIYAHGTATCMVVDTPGL